MDLNKVLECPVLSVVPFFDDLVPYYHPFATESTLRFASYRR